MEWQEVAEDFKGDGTLRDIYVFDTSASVWQAVYEAVRAAYEIVLHPSDSLPNDVLELFAWEDVPTLLTIDAEGLCISCQFFRVDEIEFSLLPNDVTSQADLDRVCRFLLLVGQAAEKDVVLTMENCRDWIILKYDVHAGKVAGGRA